MKTKAEAKKIAEQIGSVYWQHDEVFARCMFLAVLDVHSFLAQRSRRKNQWFSIGEIMDASFHDDETIRDAISDLVFHFIWFLLTPVLHFSPPLVGVSFSHERSPVSSEMALALLS